MAWTAPRTWVASELVTAALMNQHVRDNLDYLKASPTLTGVLTVSGFGTHTFSAGGTGTNAINVVNTTSGTGNYASVLIGNNSAADRFRLHGFTTGWTTSGQYVADGMTVESVGAGGLSIAANHASGAIRLHAGGTTEQVRIETDGDVGMKATAKLYFDGVACTGGDYITESSANVLDVYSGGIISLSLRAGFLYVNTHDESPDGTAKLVGFGANDSGGAGYRVMRVPNY